jgi:hypothetical protein
MKNEETNLVLGYWEKASQKKILSSYMYDKGNELCQTYPTQIDQLQMTTFSPNIF